MYLLNKQHLIWWLLLCNSLWADEHHYIHGKISSESGTPAWCALVPLIAASVCGRKSASWPGRDIYSIGFDHRRLVASAQCTGYSKEQFEQVLIHLYNDDIAQYRSHILTLHQYYRHDGFIALIKEFPEYQEYMLELYKQFQNSVLTRLTFRWYGVSSSRIGNLALEAERAKQEQFDRAYQPLREALSAQKEQEKKTARILSMLETQHETLAALQEQYSVFDSGEPTNSVAIHQRKRIEHIAAHQTQALRVYQHTYTLRTISHLTQRYKYSFTTLEPLRSCMGTPLQHKAHQEFIEIFEQLNDLSTHTIPVTDLETMTAESALLGCQAAHEGHMPLAYHFADFCWAALDCLQGVAQGIGDGVVSTAQLALHPVASAQQLLFNIKTAGTYLGAALVECVHTNIDTGRLLIDSVRSCFPFCETPEQKQARKRKRYTLEARMRVREQRITALCNGIAQQLETTSNRQIVRTLTSAATEFYLTGKCFNAAHTFCSKAAHHAQTLVHAARAEQIVALTADHIAVEIAAQAASTVAKMERVEEKVKAFGDAFKEFNICRYDPVIGDLALIESAIEAFHNTPGALGNNGPLRNVLHWGLKGNGNGHLNTARGALYELEKALSLQKKGEPILQFGEKIGGREFDIITSKKMIECKNINWGRMNAEAIHNKQSTFMHQKTIAESKNKIFEVHSKLPISHSWKQWFEKKGIPFFEG
jgi:hypothetical protein